MKVSYSDRVVDDNLKVSFDILSVNTRGIRDSLKRRKVFEWLKNHTGKKAVIFISFYDMNELPDGYHKVERSTLMFPFNLWSTLTFPLLNGNVNVLINLNIPIHVGVFILNYAKLWMLEFYYDCVDKYVWWGLWV